jgi:hypothetical protein
VDFYLMSYKSDEQRYARINLAKKIVEDYNIFDEESLYQALITSNDVVYAVLIVDGLAKMHVHEVRQAVLRSKENGCLSNWQLASANQFIQATSQRPHA